MQGLVRRLVDAGAHLLFTSRNSEDANWQKTRGNLDEAIRLYEESLALKDALGDKKGRPATQVMMAQVLAAGGERERALALAREALAALAAMGAQSDAEQVAGITAALEGGGRAGSAASGDELPPVVAMTRAAGGAPRGRGDVAPVRALLAQEAATAEHAELAAALAAALDQARDAAARSLQALQPELGSLAPAERARALSGVGQVAHALDDNETELAALEQVVAEQRAAGAEREVLVEPSVLLFNVAVCCQRAGGHERAEEGDT